MNQYENEMEQLESRIESEIDFGKLTEICEHLKNAIKEILNSCGIYFRIFSRVKTVHSIAEKIQRGNYGTRENPKKIQDLVGLRVVLYYYDDLSICRDITESIFQMVDDWSRPKYNPDEFKATKINGVFRFPTEYFNLYRKELWQFPIDTTFEIQFRTVFFEGWHEIEHDMRYKSFLSDDEFWKGSEELSRVLNCILANLELSDWSLVQLFDQLSYNHYTRGNWELMLKSKYRIKISDKENLDPRIVEIFDQDKDVAKHFFKGSRKHLIKELLKFDNPHVNYNLIVKLINKIDVHNEKIAAICDSFASFRDDKVYQKNVLTRLESNILFQMGLPLLHKDTRLLKTEFNNASAILYKWVRFKMNPVFEDMPAELCSYQNSLPGYAVEINCSWETLEFSMQLHYIDTQSIGTLWHVRASIALSEDGLLHFYHVTSRDTPRGISHHSTFNKPSFLTDLSNKIGIMDVVRLSNKAQYIAKDGQLSEMAELIHSAERRLPVIVIAQHTRDLGFSSAPAFHDYDMNTFTINGTRLAKVVGHYCHVFMIDYDMIADFAYSFQLLAEDIHGCICIFWTQSSHKPMELFTRKMVIDTQFDFNRFAFHDDNISEKAFRHKLVQVIKDDNISSNFLPK